MSLVWSSTPQSADWSSLRHQPVCLRALTRGFTKTRCVPVASTPTPEAHTKHIALILTKWVASRCYCTHQSLVLLSWIKVISIRALTVFIFYFYTRLPFSVVLTALFLIRAWGERERGPNQEQPLARATCPCPVCCGESQSVSIMMPMSDEAERNRAIPLTDHCGSVTAFQLTHRLLWQHEPAARAATYRARESTRVHTINTHTAALTHTLLH